jgi:hypothetical protein
MELQGKGGRIKYDDNGQSEKGAKSDVSDNNGRCFWEGKERENNL